MTYRTLLTHVVDDRECLSRLRMTASVARVLQADVIGLGAQAPWPYADGEEQSSSFREIMAKTRAEIASAGAHFREVFKDGPTASSWRMELGYPDAAVRRHARAADMIVTYPMGVTDSALYANPEALVMESGLPLLLMPRHETEFQAKRILIAWRDTREARRAISSSLPLLKGAARVLIGAICRDQEIVDIEAQIADVAQRLARHGVAATTLAEVESPGSAGRKLMRLAETDQSDLIVAGAYGHSRLREWVLGGVTRDLIADPSRYILLSH